MNNPRKSGRDSEGILIVELTPEESAKWDELCAALDQVEAALYDARRVARIALSKVSFYRKYRKALVARLLPLHKIHVPEFHQK